VTKILYRNLNIISVCMLNPISSSLFQNLSLVLFRSLCLLISSALMTTFAAAAAAAICSPPSPLALPPWHLCCCSAAAATLHAHHSFEHSFSDHSNQSSQAAFHDASPGLLFRLHRRKLRRLIASQLHASATQVYNGHVGRGWYLFFAPHSFRVNAALQSFWRLETYELADVAALMKSVMEDDDAGTASLRSEHPVACMQYEMDGWLNQRLSASVPHAAAASRDFAAAADDDHAVAGALSVRNTSGRLFDEPEAVHVRGVHVCEGEIGLGSVGRASVAV
jgi:hypothetical protein